MGKSYDGPSVDGPEILEVGLRDDGFNEGDDWAIPSARQAQNNPDKFWEGFLGRSVNRVYNVLIQADQGKHSGSWDHVLREADAVLAKLPDNQQGRGLIDSREILARAFARYFQDFGGFANERIRKHYDKWVAESDKAADSLSGNEHDDQLFAELKDLDYGDFEDALHERADGDNALIKRMQTRYYAYKEAGLFNP